MKSSKFFITFLLFVTTVFASQAQLGVRVGVNMASEITSFNQESLKNSFKTENLTGYQVGLVYQAHMKNGLGFETGLLLAQKGSVYKIDNAETPTGNFVKAYKELNCINIPLSLRYRYSFGPIGVFALAGLYGDYALNGKTVVEAVNNQLESKESFKDFSSRLDYGYTLGGGVEFIKKIQLGVNWSTALQKKDPSDGFQQVIKDFQPQTQSRVFSVNLTYIF